MYVSPSDLLGRYSSGERNFAGISFFVNTKPGTMLCEVDLSDIILSGAYLSNITMHETDFSKATMIGTYLVDSRLYMSDLSGADLTGANLSGAYLGYTNLRKANLTGANLTGANLTGADMTDVFLESANLSQVDLSRIKLYDKLPRTFGAFCAENALLWETILPDGTIERGPRYFI